LIELVVVRLKELNADKEVCEEVAQQTETAALSMEVNPQTPPSSDVPVHLMIPSLSAPSKNSLNLNQESLLHTYEGPKVTVVSKDDEVNESGGS